uniref:Aminopeptidase n=1 Tax=Electrophorus electricus TaxID=8005 RepID=A0A4W4GGH6_ELEEL
MSLSILLVGLCVPLSWAAVTHVSGEDEPPFPVATNGQPFPWNKMRLPQAASPRHYDLLLHPNLTTLDFTGRVKIQVEVLQDTHTLVLHSKDLTISKAALLGPAPGQSHALRVLEYPPYQQVAVVSEREELKRGGVYVVELDFAANLSESFRGFYKSTYRTTAGEQRVLASTHFEPTSARAAFPCFDEPAFKANFSVRIRREGRHMAISNMPKVLRTVVLPGGLFEDQFDVTVKMSTYLVAFIVCDFLSISKKTQHGVQMSVYAIPEKISQAEFALDAAVRLLDFYDDYFDIPYPLPKQDLAAIPDFQSGAMENWGLTTYRESALLFDPHKSSASDKLGITMIIAHELAHQWFGNLVTMQWWNDLWLNEGFAKFMEFVSVNITNPELQVEDYFLEKCFEAMEVDSLSSSHPVSTPVENPAQIQEMFDDVSYDKGACILHMLREFLSPEVFKMGIVQYLKRYSYQNTINTHLWESLTTVSTCLGKYCVCVCVFVCFSQKRRSEDELDVKVMMETWTLQEGFPLITVEVKGREVRLSQERYLKSDDPSQTSGRFLWHVPLTYVTSISRTVHRFLLKSKTDVLYLLKEVDWIKFNVDMSGYYIVHYEGSGWDDLTSLLRHNHTALSSNDRASLINNAFQLVSVGKLALDKALDLSLYLSRETEIMPVTQGLRELVPLYKLMEKRDMEDTGDNLKIYIVHLFRELIERQEWSDAGSVSERMLRSYLLLFACVRGHPPCVATATELFNKWRESDGSMSLPNDVSLAVFAVGARTQEGWDFLFEKYRESMYTSIKSRIKSALSISPLAHKLKWMMEQNLEGSVMKTQDLPYVVVSVSNNPKGHKHAWDFLQTYWNLLVKKFDLGSHSIAHMVIGVTSQYSTREMLEEIREFFGSLSAETGADQRCIQQALENVEENIRWTDKNLPLLQAWLNKNHAELVTRHDLYEHAEL